ncbi:MAG: hypothetical protein ACYTGN_14315 [Planctomycetota bacterium]|jgi:hypothetical protein
MRILAALVVVSAVALADEYEDIVAEVVAGRLERARDLATAHVGRLPADKALRGLRDAIGVALEARDLQRTQGYDAAIARLGNNLDHWLLAEAFAEACRWGGREEHGVQRLRASGLSLEQRIRPELDLLHAMLRFQEMEWRASAAKAELAQRGVQWAQLDEWIRVARDELEKRVALRGRGTRAGWLALGGAVVMLGAWGLLMRGRARGR